MPLNLSVGDGDFVPYLKYNAKAGRFYVKPEGASEEVEITNPLLAFDMANIKTGWLYYAEGSGPEKVWDPSPTQMAPKPPGPKKFKRGFEVMVFGNTMLPGGKPLGLREFSSTAGNVIAALLRMHATFEAGGADTVGKVPVFKCIGVKPITGAYGVNYEPQFELTTWVGRDKVPAFDEHDEAPPKPNGSNITTGPQPRTKPPLDEARGDPLPGSYDHDEQVPF